MVDYIITIDRILGAYIAICVICHNEVCKYYRRWFQLVQFAVIIMHFGELLKEKERERLCGVHTAIKY